MSDELLVGGQSALAEARLLYRIIGPENTVEKLRDLILVPPKIEKVLRAYMKESPEDAWWIEQGLEFRRDILKEFNRLVRDGSSNCLEEHGPDLPEVEEQPSIDQGLKEDLEGTRILTRTTAVRVLPRSEDERNTFWLSDHTAGQEFLEGFRALPRTLGLLSRSVGEAGGRPRRHGPERQLSATRSERHG